MSEKMSDIANYEPGQRQAKILVVDDQPTNVRTIHQIFSDLYEVFVAQNGEQALAFCHGSPPDLVLLDVEMPGMSGLEVCRRLKQHAETMDIPVIFVTGRERPEDETACWDAGCVDFVSKPVNAVTLRNRVGVHLKLKFQTDLLREMVFVDGLTGVANRRYFDERLALEWRRCHRNNLSLALIIADVDWFKRYNDNYGHQAGDDCLRKVATALKGVVRHPIDLVARYGGEEFVCLLPETDDETALTIANRMDSAVRNLKIVHSASEAGGIVTISMGVAVTVPDVGNSRENLVRMADTQLYRAKQQGRACIRSEALTPV